MARKNNATNTSETLEDEMLSNASAEPLFNEDDFDDNSEEWRDVRVPYWHVQEGAKIVGEVVEKHFNVDSKFGPRDLIDVILLQDTIVAAGKKQTVKLPKGSLCRIAYRAAMGPLMSMLEPGDGISLTVTGKAPTQKGNDCWTFKVKRRSAKKVEGGESDEEG